MAIIFLDCRMFIGAIDITCNYWYVFLLPAVSEFMSQNLEVQ